MSDEPVMTPIPPTEGATPPPKVSPFGASPAPAAAAPAASAAPAVSTIKLKPVIRKPVIHKPVIGGARPPEPAAPAAAKKATQNLKSVTGPIPAQATLRKTGIVAEGILTPQQQQAAKSKTSRISLESAIGVAPVSSGAAAAAAPSSGAAPLKTIRLRRPTDLSKPAASSAAPVSATDTQSSTILKPSPVPPPAPAPAAAGAAPDASVTQKKTLKLHRPGAGGIKRPSLGIGTKPADASATDGGVKDIADLGSVPEIKPLGAADFDADSGSSTSAGVPSWVAALSLITTLAALLVVGVVVWYLWQEGVGPVAGANEMQFLQM